MAERERVEAVRQIIRHRMLKERFDKHRELVDKHRERGPVFAAAVDRLAALLQVHKE